MKDGEFETRHTVMLAVEAVPTHLFNAPMFHSSPHCKSPTIAMSFFRQLRKLCFLFGRRTLHCSRLWLIDACVSKLTVSRYNLIRIKVKTV